MHRVFLRTQQRAVFFAAIIYLSPVFVFVGCSKKTSPTIPDPFPDLHIMAIEPAAEATNVEAKMTDIVITFSAEMTLDGLGLVMAPSPPGFYDNLRLSTDRRQVISTVELAANTTYAILIYAGFDRFGDFLRAPEIRYFTTGSSFASGAVSGTVAAPFAKPLQSFAGLLDQSVQAIFDADSPDDAFYASLVSIGTIQNEQGNFLIERIAGGTYWPFAALDQNRDGNFSISGGDRLLGYDADDDQAADSFSIPAASSTIEIALPIAGLTVESTSPTDGMTNVAEATTFRVRFSKTVTADSSLGLFIAPVPAGLKTSDLQLSPDGREIFANVSLEPNTAYTAILYAARSTNGQLLGTPLQVSFSTGSSFPEGSVSGQAVLPPDLGSPQNAIVGLLNESLGAVIARAFTDPDPTQVLADALVAITLVQNEDGDYTINHVPAGTYWPAGTRDDDLDGSIEPIKEGEPGEPIGFYDKDGDGNLFQADSITLNEGQALGSIDLTFVRLSGPQ